MHFNTVYEARTSIAVLTLESCARLGWDIIFHSAVVRKVFLPLIPGSFRPSLSGVSPKPWIKVKVKLTLEQSSKV
jgi:hypothetical protein